VKSDFYSRSKKIALGVIVIAMGALGVAGGSRTISLFKHWIHSLFQKGTT
jgi:hypothetical protein